MNGELVTKRDLAEAVTGLRGEMAAMKDELRGDMATMKDELRGEMVAMKDELRGDMATMKDELRGDMATMKDELRGDMAAMRTELRGDMAAMRTELLHEIGAALSHVAKVMTEEVARNVTIVEEKYQDLPREHGRLRDDFDVHAADLRLHQGGVGPAPRRDRRPRTR